MKRLPLSALALTGLLSLSGCATQSGMHRGPGWTMVHPTVHVAFLGEYWTANPMETAGYVTRWDQLLNSPGHVLDRLAEYGVNGGTFDTAVDFAAPGITDGVSEIDLTMALTAEIGSGKLPTPSDDTLYVLMLPPGVSSAFARAHSSIGYHLANEWHGKLYAYAVVEYRGSPVTDIILSHELYEAATDPTALGWADYSTFEEIGDLCESQTDVIDNIVVQKVWSAAANVCL
jgi:hypothetical protein